MRSPDESVPFAQDIDTYASGMCANFTYYVLDAVAVGIPDANAAWERSVDKTSDPARNPPRGAPVWFSGGKYGHVCLSIGGGKVRSTDQKSAGKVSDVTIDQIENSWGYPYRGYANDWAGQPIPGLPAGSTDTGATDEEDEEVKQEDIDKIADAVWDYLINRRDLDPMHASAMLLNTYERATQARDAAQEAANNTK